VPNVPQTPKFFREAGHAQSRAHHVGGKRLVGGKG
jgi:hypothetical protein